MSDKFLFTVKSFLNMKGILDIVQMKHLLGNQLLLTMEFDGEVLKVIVRYYNVTPKINKVIYQFKSYKPDHESKKVTDHSDYTGDSEDSDSEDASHSRWTVECHFRSIQEFFSDELTKNILDVVQEELSHEDYKDEKDPQIGSVYLSYSESNEESQSLLAPRERKGSLVITISNRKPSSTSIACKHCCKKDKKKYTMIRHMVRISVNVLSVKVKDLSVTPSLVTPRCRRRLEF